MSRAVDREEDDRTEAVSVGGRMEPETGDVLGEADPVSGELAESHVHSLCTDLLVELNRRGDPSLYRGIVGTQIPVIELVYAHGWLVEGC